MTAQVDFVTFIVHSCTSFALRVIWVTFYGAAVLKVMDQKNVALVERR